MSANHYRIFVKQCFRSLFLPIQSVFWISTTLSIPFLIYSYFVFYAENRCTLDLFSLVITISCWFSSLKKRQLIYYKEQHWYSGLRSLKISRLTWKINNFFSIRNWNWFFSISTHWVSWNLGDSNEWPDTSDIKYLNVSCWFFSFIVCFLLSTDINGLRSYGMC